jgi:hypothetical protein
MNFGSHHDLGAATFRTWNEEQQRDEIGKLVKGFRNAVPLGVLCKMAETIAGSRDKAREHLAHFMPLKERKRVVAREIGGMRIVAEEFLL